MLSGDIASVFSNLPATMIYFDYSNNSFYGTIPAAASALTSLLAIRGFNNDQVGDVADLIGNLPPGIQTIDLSNNILNRYDPCWNFHFYKFIPIKIWEGTT